MRKEGSLSKINVKDLEPRNEAGIQKLSITS